MRNWTSRKVRNKGLLFPSLLGILILLYTAADVPSQAVVELLEQISKIKAVDNHSHVEKVTEQGKPDLDGDAIGCGGLEFISPPPLRLRTDNPIYLDAWRGLFGFASPDMSAGRIQEYLRIKQAAIQTKGDNYPAWILDKLNIDVMLANRVAMGKGLNNKRFRWVSYGDPFLLPFETKKVRQANSDQRFFYSQEEKLFRRYLTEAKIARLPSTLDLYFRRFVTPTLERQKDEGAVGIKFVAAYYRSLEFDTVSKQEAEKIYRAYVNGGEPGPLLYKKFQDYVFRYVAAEAGRLGLAVHIHTGGGCGHYFNLRTANPILLESVLNDPALRKTNFVLIHGGYPYTNETAFLMEKPNVYADFSAQTFLLPPQSLSKVLRSWLEYEPEKVLFGSDASPASPEVGWEESAWMTTNTARRALAIALSNMIADGEISWERALELARMVLRENALRLYKLDH